MDFNIEEQLPSDFHLDSKVWIYQCSRQFTISEALQIEAELHNFVAQWKSHGTPVKGFANLLFGRFVVLIADETSTGVSGCSTDSSVHIIKKIEATYNVNLFDRQQLAFVVKDKVETLPLAQIQYALTNNFITPDTLYFNNTVLTLKDFKTNWLIPIKNSWLASRLKMAT